MLAQRCRLQYKIGSMSFGRAQHNQHWLRNYIKYTNCVNFGCDMGKYSTGSMNRMWAFRRIPYSLNEWCIFPYRNEQHKCVFPTIKSHMTWLQYIAVHNFRKSAIWVDNEKSLMVKTTAHEKKRILNSTSNSMALSQCCYNVATTSYMMGQL